MKISITLSLSRVLPHNFCHAPAPSKMILILGYLYVPGLLQTEALPCLLKHVAISVCSNLMD